MARPPVLRSAPSTTPPLAQSANRNTKAPPGRTKEPAHLPLHRRLLFPTLPIEQPLPHIILANGSKRPELDVLNDRLYRIIALVLRAYVLSWYPRFSRDRTLLPTLSARIVVPLLSPILSGVYNDPDHIVQLFLLELPNLLTLHCSTYWQARDALIQTPHLYHPASDPSRPSPTSAGIHLGEIYHSRLPLLAVAPSPGTSPPNTEGPYRHPIPSGQYALSPLYLTSLTDALLRLHLPAAEYGCTVERVMAREIVGRVVLGAVGAKLGEGWFWWSLALKFMGTASPRKEAEDRSEEGIQRWADMAVKLFFRLYTAVLLLWSFAISLSARYTASPPAEERYRDCAQPWLALGREVLGVDGRAGISPKRWGLRLSWGTVEGIANLLGPLIDRLVPHLIRSGLTPQLSLRIVDLLEWLLFPLDGYPGPSPPDLTPEEAKVVGKAFESRLSEVIPIAIQAMFFPSPSDIGLMLDPLDNAGCNAHLIAMILDSVVAALEPALDVPLPPAHDEADCSRL